MCIRDRVTVNTLSYSVDQGRYGASQVNYVTKSGSNRFHGNLYELWNGSRFNAADYFTNATPGNHKPRSTVNHFGGSLGGPIIHDKLFFFFNTEGLRVLIPVQASPVFVPTTAFETATVANLTALGLTSSIPYYCQNLSGICSGVSGVPGSGNGIFNFFNAMKNNPSALQNNLPLGGCDNVPTTTGAFAGFGAGNPCMDTLKETPINFAPEKQYAGRVDWNIGNNDRAYMRCLLYTSRCV